MDTDKTYKIIIKTHAGLENVVAQELVTLGCPQPEILVRAVAVRGDDSLLYKINYCCRTALKVLKVFNEFKFSDNSSFYTQIKTLPWERYLKPDGSLAVDAIQNKSIFNNTHYIARFTKDAIADRFRELYKQRPSVDLNAPDVYVNIYIHQGSCTVSLDSSGQSLHKRGYKMLGAEAPVNEVTAAGIIRLSGWQANENFFDPMCGSGTLLLEAAMQAKNLPGAYYRKNLAFMKWLSFDEEIYKRVVDEAAEKIAKIRSQICGADISEHNVRKSNENTRLAKLNRHISVTKSDFFATVPPFKKGVIITNPPYGERLKIEDNKTFYKKIGDTLKQKYAGYTAWVFTQNMETHKYMGLRPSRKITLYNGKIECKLLKYDLYDGRKTERTIRY